jgi:hypothetical protein
VKSPACDVIGVFAFKEMERQRETHGPKGTGILFFYVKEKKLMGCATRFTILGITLVAATV